MFSKIGEKFRKIHRKHLRWSLFLIKLQTLFITDAVAVCGYFKNNLQLILYGVEIRSCQRLFNLIQQFYVQNQKYKFEKKKKEKKAWHLFNNISKHTKTALNYIIHVSLLLLWTCLHLDLVFPLLTISNLIPSGITFNVRKWIINLFFSFSNGRCPRRWKIFRLIFANT